MKLASVLLSKALPGSGAWATSLLTAAKGFELTLNESSRMIAVKHGDTVKLIAVEKTDWCEPLSEKAAKK